MQRTIEISKGLFWVGSRDPDIRVFDLIMQTAHGTSYNAYLVRGKTHTALIDTTKARFAGNLLEAIGEILPPAEIDYIVSNHTEPDHAGALGAVIDAAPKATVVATGRGAQFLSDQLNRPFPVRKVKAGDTLDLGGRTLSFIPSPFLHWPDSMFTYLNEDRVLFSGDVFGAHFCPPEGVILDSDSAITAQQAELDDSFRHYYLTIMAPFAGHVQKGQAKLAGLAIDLICPSHGPIRAAGVKSVQEQYARFTSPGERPRIAVFFASIYGYTRALAEALVEGIQEAGVDVQRFDLESADPWEVLHSSWEAQAIAVGTPTLNGGPAPQAAAVLAGLDAHRSKGKPFFAFGSYGWSGEAPDQLTERAKDLKMAPIEPLKVAFVPTAEDLATARERGQALAKALSP